MVGPPAAGGPGRRGSGYRVGPRWVVTAAHVVRRAGPDAVRVRFEADRTDEWTVSARVVLAAEKADVALLEIAEPPPGSVHAVGIEPPVYGAVPDADVVLPCTALGFPRFKLREDRMRLLDDGSPSQFRDSCHATGMTSVLSNRREGTLELAVTPPESDAEPDRSPWEGMSGAAVWHDGTLIGLVAAHHRNDGLGRLAAVRVERWYELLTGSELDLLRWCAGLPGSAPELVRFGSPESSAPGPFALTHLPDRLPLRELSGLVDALTALPTVRDPAGLALVLGSIDPMVSAMSPRSPALRPDVFGILGTCLRYPGTLDQLLEAIRLLEGDSAGVARMDQEAVELARRHRPADERR
ncbi:trypsin-like serine protease [Streptomyces sp. HUCO-GS316]|uniref:effector-associated domain 2-containing protein n=1 Tax=Streptomyces sp. HUCO-GS316 TaxID=2692198 RepID=UPI00136830D5|nr:trypsin-like peptidase domain-containing protein [Streptomyces sp. HUCO-GS316]MXM67574.1 trypsin-like serine protease [Streptomyces sp. HUCO-GS316]